MLPDDCAGKTGPTISTAEAQPRVQWAELRPDEFHARLAACPIAWLPLGLCEPHGQVAALGLDALKAEAYCSKAAARNGGIVVPGVGWHIHESGYHARWLEEVVGEENAMMTSLPPHVFLHHFLYQLRACVNAGFRGVFVLTGHAGAQADLRLAAAAFAEASGLSVKVSADYELVAGKFRGDHAGRFEISQLMHLRPELVDLALLDRQDMPGAGGRLALGPDAGEATLEYGRAIDTAVAEALADIVAEWRPLLASGAMLPPVSFATTERIWAGVWAQRENWVTLRPRREQAPVSEESRWKQGEQPP